MNTAAKIVSILIAIALLYFLDGCGEEPNPCRFSEIKLGMSEDEVVNVMGKPDKITDDKLTNMFATGSLIMGWTMARITYHYYCGNTEIQIEFDDGVVSDIDEY